MLLSLRSFGRSLERQSHLWPWYMSCGGRTFTGPSFGPAFVASTLRLRSWAIFCLALWRLLPRERFLVQIACVSSTHDCGVETNNSNDGGEDEKKKFVSLQWDVRGLV